MATSNEVWCERCGCVMKRRKGKFGEFYGCTGYPNCMRTKSLTQAEGELEDHDLGLIYEPPQTE